MTSLRIFSKENSSPDKPFSMPFSFKVYLLKEFVYKDAYFFRFFEVFYFFCFFVIFFVGIIVYYTFIESWVHKLEIEVYIKSNG